MKANSVFKYLVLSGLFLIPFIPFIVSSSMLFPFITGKGFAFRIITEIIFVLWVIIALKSEQYRPKKSIILWSVAIFTAIVGVADLLSVNSYKSFWSNFERMEGFITILHLFLFFLVSISILKTESLWRKYIGVWVGSGVLMGIYAIFQLAGKLTINQGGVRVDGTFGNATYLAIYLVFIAFFATLLFVRSKKFHWWLYVPILVFILSILYHTATRGAILGLLGGAVVALALIFFSEKGKTKLKKTSAVVLVAVLIVIGGVFSGRKSAFVKNNPVLARFGSLSTSEIKSQGRYFVWPMALRGFKEKPIFGWGQEGFNYVFNKNYDPRMYSQEQWFDRSHNAVLDWLVAGGLLGALSYLSLFAAVVWLLWKKSKLPNAEKSIITGLLAAYFFNNIFVFDNLISYILFFLTIAYVHYESSEEPTLISKSIGPTAQRIVGPVLIVALVFSVYFANIKPIKASQTLISTLKELGTNGPSDKVLDLYEKAFSYGTFADQEVLEQLASSVGTFINSDIPTETKQRYLALVVDKFQKSIEGNPDDARPHLFYGLFLNRAGSPETALKELNRALELSPKKQAILFEIGNIYIDAKDYEKSLEYFKRAFELEPEFIEARIGYGLAALYVKKDQLANEILSEVPPNQLINDDRLAGPYIARNDNATLIQIFTERVRLNPDDVQSSISLAIVYLRAGQRLSSAGIVRGFIEKHPEYKDQLEPFLNDILAGKSF